MTVIPTDLNEARLISNSEVDSRLTCERKHLFSFVFERESKHKSRSLNLGIIGHEVLAVFYKALQAGLNRIDAEQEAMKYLTQLFVSEEYPPDDLATVHVLLSRYFAQDTLTGNVKILEVETDFYLPINDDYWYAMRLDLLVEALVGSMKGHVLLIDHKFTYDFYSYDDLKLNPQMPKYVVPVMHAGYPVKDAYINQIRTRFPSHLIGKKSNEELFQRMPVGLTKERIKSALAHQMKMSERIIALRKMPLELQIEESVPVLNKMICRNCPFKNACEMVEDGMSFERALGPEYKKRSYGYTKAIEDGS
jgi:hypothetical protein